MITNMVIATVIIAEIGFVIWLLIKWLHGNVNINWSPVLNIEESARRGSDSSVEKQELDNLSPKDIGPVEVDINKNIFIDKADSIDIKSDKIKGKVKTQKDKLKKLMRK